MKSVLITGASSGIGADLARLRARAGDHLALVARRDHVLREVQEECLNQGAASVRALIQNVTDLGASPKLKECLSAGGEPVLVNNAGVATFGDLTHREWKDWRSDMEVNLLATMRVTHAALPIMLERGGGLIVNVCSVAAQHVFPGAAVYSASKAALLQFGNCIREEYRRAGIRVCNILPGATNTPLWKNPDSTPPVESMLGSLAVAEAISHIIDLPADRAVEELRITPPLGIL